MGTAGAQIFSDIEEYTVQRYLLVLRNMPLSGWKHLYTRKTHSAEYAGECANLYGGSIVTFAREFFVSMRDRLFTCMRKS